MTASRSWPSWAARTPPRVRRGQQEEGSEREREREKREGESHRERRGGKREKEKEREIERERERERRGGERDTARKTETWMTASRSWPSWVQHAPPQMRTAERSRIRSSFSIALRCTISRRAPLQIKSRRVSIYLSTYQSTYLSIYLFIYLLLPG